MKKIIFGFIFVATSVTVFAQQSHLDLYQGESVKINVLDCKQDENAKLVLNDSLNTVSVSCVKASCQAQASGENYNVYRFQENECTWEGCHQSAKLVGSFVSKKSFFTQNLKKDMAQFLSASNECASIRSFINGFHGFVEIKNNYKKSL